MPSFAGPKCTEFDGGDFKYLKADLSMNCDNERYLLMTVVRSKLESTLPLAE